MSVRKSLLLAGSMIVFSLAMALAQKLGYLGDEVAQRAIQVAIGLVVVYTGNLAPKTLEPLSATCDPARVQSLQRFTGWAIVLGGLGYSLAWLVAPFEYAAVASMSILGTAALLVSARFAWTLKTRRSPPPSEL